MHPSRLPPADVTPFLPECAANGYPDPTECGEWYGLHRSAARTTSFLIDHLDDLSPFLRGRVDASKIVVGGHSGEPVPTRLAAWITSPPGDKLLLWDTDPHAVHETMDIDKCEPRVSAGHCDRIASAGLAYLDAVVRRRSEARAWLESDAIKTFTGSAIELHRR